MVGLAAFGSYAAIIYGTGGTSAARYAFPMMLALFVHCAMSRPWSGTSLQWDEWVATSVGAPTRRTVFVLAGVLAALLPWAPSLLASQNQFVRAKFETRNAAALVKDDVRASYLKAQAITEPGSALMVSATLAYLLDPRRNDLLINDQFGAVGPQGGWPRTADPNALLSYLQKAGIQYWLVSQNQLVQYPPNNLPPWLKNLVAAWELVRVALGSPVFESQVKYSDKEFVLYRISAEHAP